MAITVENSVKSEGLQKKPSLGFKSLPVWKKVLIIGGGFLLANYLFGKKSETDDLQSSDTS